MADTYVFFAVTSNLKVGLTDIDELDDDVITAARRAVNRVSDLARTESSRRMRDQVRFPARYLTSEGRLQVTKRAKDRDIEAIVTGRRAPTSLARFVTGRPRPGQGVRVEVKPGAARYMRRGFLMKLSNSNMGLAVRTDGGKPSGAYKPKKINDNLWLVYGPAVDQVFRTVAEDVAEPTADRLQDEFNRLLEWGRGT